MNRKAQVQASRRYTDRLMSLLMVASTVVVVLPLALVLFYVGSRGISAINWEFFTELPRPAGEPGGGMANAIVGSLIVTGLAALIGLPVGIGAGVYLAEFGRNRYGNVIRFITDVLNGVPSIVVGIFVYAWIVIWMKHYSAIAAGIALGIIMIPIVTRTTEEMVRLVPQSLREASLALGVPVWRTTLSIVLRSALRGIVTGAMLAVARVGGETAPLLFTALNNRYWHTGLNEPIATLPIQIFNNATVPYEESHKLAAAGAFVLVAMVLLINVLARVITYNRHTAAR